MNATPRVLVFVVPVLIGCAPDGIARASCESIMLATGDPRKCRITGPTIDKASSLTFDTESRNQVAQARISLRVDKGALRVGYRDLVGDKVAIVTPEAPLSLEMQTRMHRDRRSFTLSFDPQGKEVAGLTGTVDYSTP
jgi:hypothetical protein